VKVNETLNFVWNRPIRDGGLDGRVILKVIIIKE
jgi:hypothetical protein